MAQVYWAVIADVTQGQYTAMAIVLAAKSVVCYPQASRSEAFAGYYLTSTLASMTVAIAAGLLLNGLERVLGG